MAETRRWPREFWQWARENGLPPRGPRGSEINLERKKIIPRLYKQWKELQRSS